ncbi:G-type lectin S-receptor-like serine/threonine-protein kinase At1g34300 [Salvia miltiorrhiza]|uniref:G-type lectin S-receptor-like serine/threonine-protein kinase At1g34300 n=1 Tax=Salvia miltiorrhiza TaxID=226208 RepID=UPI0025ACA7E9|nr:G-type lectin S-receptor-like serine/threonine-protein kinase At1g34300 [Salvia miltiorrhiza]
MELSSFNMFLLFLILFSAAAIVAQDILPGSTLHASNPQQSWTSPNKSFTLSFIHESDNAYFAAITYNGVPIWRAGGDPGGSVNSSAELRFLQDGNLQLVVVAGPTTSLVWQSNTSGQGIDSASLDNSGNFMLKNGNVPIWTTFDNPTDTIMPEQNFTVGDVLRCGFYSFHLLSSGRISLRWNSSVEYYTYAGINVTNTLNVSSPSLAMQSVGILSLLDPLFTNDVFMARGSDYGPSDDTLRFVKLDCDGNMRMYSSSLSDGVGSRVVRWTAVSDQCEVFGFCGSFGVCRYDDTDAGPICGCPSRNFEPVDPNDGRRGCRMRGDIRSCQTTMLSLNNTLFLTFPPQIDTDYFTANIRACRSNCLVDSTCVASSSMADGTGVCYMKRSDFISGYHSQILTSTSYVKVCDPAMPNPPVSSRKDGEGSAALEIGVIVLGSSLFIVILVGGFLLFKCRDRPSYESLVSEYSFSDYASGVPVQFSYKKLQQLTKGFKEKLGEGGFGSVYRGILSNKMVVAVKQLEGIGQGEKQFRMEVATISNTHHLNLVRLVGFCSEGKHRLLVYEFMKNGSLDNFIFESSSSSDEKILDWDCRYRIALGTAKGMTYLHEECRDCILHCDIKPENILLDESYNARISDFGLARMLNLNDHRHRSLITVRGTRGYLAPEWIANLPVTSKADVYSYGMVLLEIVSGRRNFEVSPETGNRRFSLWAYEEFEKGNVGAVVDRRLVESDIDIVQAMRLLQVSFWCIQEHPSPRPTMGKVVQMLEGIADVQKPPPPLFLADGSAHPSAVISSVSSSQMTAISSLVSS